MHSTRPPRLFALVDGNNFYASFERVFRPSLNGRPVVVLSNNEGCAIARSDEAKAMSIKMGAPWFEIRHMEHTYGLVALSANFALYGDLSDRMMSLVAGLGHRQEVYSIDESFVELTGIRGDLMRRGSIIRERVLRWMGIPCCIGIGPTKTLTKLANHIAKSAEAVPHLRLALQAMPDDPQSIFGLACALDDLGTVDSMKEADSLFLRVIEEHSTLPVAGMAVKARAKLAQKLGIA